jgi:hypothetical protein
VPWGWEFHASAIKLSPNIRWRLLRALCHPDLATFGAGAHPMSDEPIDQALDTDAEESAIEMTGEETVIEDEEVEPENETE